MYDNSNASNQHKFSSVSLGTITNAANLAGWRVGITLEFNCNDATATTPATGQDCFICWSIRAKATGAGSWAKYWYGGTSGWDTYDESLWNTLNNAGITPTTSFSFNLPSTGNVNIFDGLVESDAAFTGDWDFEIFHSYKAYHFYGVYFIFSGHLSNSTFLLQNPQNLWKDTSTSLYGRDVTFRDAVDNVTGLPLSYMKPISSTATGGALLTTTTTNTNETEKQHIDKLYWGDTVSTNEPASLEVYDGANWVFTLLDGEWRKGRTGLFNKSNSELLCQSRLYNQQQNDYKWSLVTAISSINKDSTDASGVRPLYINPVGLSVTRTV